VEVKMTAVIAAKDFLLEDWQHFPSSSSFTASFLDVPRQLFIWPTVLAFWRQLFPSFLRYR
jgi:hypothetical protein